MEEDVDLRMKTGLMGGGFAGGMGGCVVWVRWAPHGSLGWYVGPGLSLLSFRLWFWFQECSSRNDTVALPLPSVQRLLRHPRQ